MYFQVRIQFGSRKQGSIWDKVHLFACSVPRILGQIYIYIFIDVDMNVHISVSWDTHFAVVVKSTCCWCEILLWSRSTSRVDLLLVRPFLLVHMPILDWLESYNPCSIFRWTFFTWSVSSYGDYGWLWGFLETGPRLREIDGFRPLPKIRWPNRSSCERGWSLVSSSPAVCRSHCMADSMDCCDQNRRFPSMNHPQMAVW